MSFKNRKLTIFGLGVHGGGVAAARYCARQGAVVRITDRADCAVLAESISALDGVPISRFTLGRHREADFATADIVVVNPAIAPGNSLVELARSQGARITSETELFLNAAHEIGVQVIGVTGTVGKSTTCTMLASMLGARGLGAKHRNQIGGNRIWLGGNIGHSLLDDLSAMSAGDIAILELSSFQLHWLSDECRWPMAAVITNCSPNHLDWHQDWSHYVASKQRLVARLPVDGGVVFDPGDAEVASWRAPLPHPQWIAAKPFQPAEALRVPGQHNRTNAALAATLAIRFGASHADIETALANFVGLPHRLAFVAEIEGRRFYNDSKSTTPAATIAALEAMDRPVWLMLGGADKQIDLSELARFAAKTAKGVAVFGAVGPVLHRQLSEAGAHCHEAAVLDEALAWCWRASHRGEAVLLSPGCASTDQFRDFSARGDAFVRAVGQLCSSRELDCGVQ